MYGDFFNDLKINYLSEDKKYEEEVTFFLEEWFSTSDKVSVQTSGSTGIPKIFEIEKEKMRNSAKMTCDFLDLKENQTALLCLPTQYISGKMMVVRALERNLQLIASSPSLTPLKNVVKAVDFCAMTPLQVEHSLDKLHLIKKIIIGGAAVSEQLKKKIYQSLEAKTLEDDHHQTTIYETYGMSETLSHIALRQIFPKEEKVFTILEGVSISTDERDRLRIFAPKLNAEVLQTNDMVELKNEKQFRFLGRVDNIINSGGAKIVPEALEALAKKEIQNEVVFLGIPDEILGQRLIAVIEGEPSEQLKQLVQNLVFEKKYHRPKDVIFIEEIPRTPNGKVERKKLLNQIEDERL